MREGGSTNSGFIVASPEQMLLNDMAQIKVCKLISNQSVVFVFRSQVLVTLVISA